MMVMLESDSRNESFARVCVASFMTRMNPTVAETDDVKTAVSEAVTNTIVHGYPYEKGLIRLVCAIEKTTDRKGAFYTLVNLAQFLVSC